MKAIQDFNFYKYDGVPIRMNLTDRETRSIIKSNWGNLFVKNLHPDLEVKQLHNIFSKFGQIISCKIVFDQVQIPKSDNPDEFVTKIVSRNYGYVQFRYPQDSKKAMKALNNQMLLGQPIEIQPYNRNRTEDPNEKFTNCYIKNIPNNFTDRDLANLFSEFGTPVSSKVVMDPSQKKNVSAFVVCQLTKKLLELLKN